MDMRGCFIVIFICIYLMIKVVEHLLMCWLPWLPISLLWASQVALVVKNPPANAGDTRGAGSIPGFEDPLEKGMATHSSILAWKIPWTEEPGGLQSVGLLRVGHDWATSLSLFTFMHWRRKWQLTPVFFFFLIICILGNSLVVQCLGLCTLTPASTGSIRVRELGSHKPHSAVTNNNNGHSNGYERLFHCDFYLHLPND